MKTVASPTRLLMFQHREKKLHLLQLEIMIKEFEHMSQELEIQISQEEQKTGIKDIQHFAYSVIAKSARLRRDNLLESISNLQNQIHIAQIELNEIENELEKAKALGKREGQTPSAEASAKDSAPFVQRRAIIS